MYDYNLFQDLIYISFEDADILAESYVFTQIDRTYLCSCFVYPVVYLAYSKKETSISEYIYSFLNKEDGQPNYCLRNLLNVYEKNMCLFTSYRKLNNFVVLMLVLMEAIL